MKQRVVVLGAGGFIGRRIVSALAACDWATPVAAGHSRPVGRPTGVETMMVDVTSAASLRPAFTGASAIVNCVAGNAATLVDGARVLFSVTASMQPPPRVVHLSTMSVYGSTTGLVDEAAALRGDLDVYSAAKTAAEQLSAGHPDVVHLRPGIVYGPESPLWSGLLGELLLARRLGDLGAAGAGVCNLVHVDDVAKAVLLTLRQPGIEGQAFNLSSPMAPTWNGYFQRYADALGAGPVRRISAARLAYELRLLGPLLKITELIAGRAGVRTPPPIRPWLTALCRHDIRLNVARAERALGLQWTPLDRGLRETAVWFRAARRP